MEIAAIILFGGVLVFAAHFFSWLFSFTKVPDVLLLLIVGLILGPITGVLQPTFFGQAGILFSIIVLAIILFEAGVNLRLDILKQAWHESLFLTLINLALFFLVIGVPVWLLTDLGLLLSFMLAAIVSGIDSAMAIPLLHRLKLTQESQAIIVLEAAFTDVSSIVLTIALLRAYELGTFDASSFVSEVLFSFFAAAVIGALGGLVWSILLNKIRHIQNSIFTTPAYAFILFGISELIGSSGPIAVLAFGVTMGNIMFFKLYLERKHIFLHSLIHPVTLSNTERTFFSELVFILQTLFFVYVGMSMRLTNPTVLVTALCLVALMFIARIPAVRLAIAKRIPVTDASFISVIVPVGLAAAVLGSLPQQQGIEGGQLIQNMTYAIILFSTILTSLMVFLVTKTRMRNLYASFFARKNEEVALAYNPGQEEPKLPS